MIAATSTACASHINHPSQALEAYADAVLSANWSAAYRLLGEDVIAGMSEDEFSEQCVRNESLLRAQAESIRQALHAERPEVTARVPLDVARSAHLVWTDDRWFLDEQLPLLQGGDTPGDTMVALAAALRSDAMQDVLGMLSPEMRGRYTAEIDALASALVQGAGGVVSVYGERASVELGDVTLQFRRQDGVWLVDRVQQARSYNYYGYDDW